MRKFSTESIIKFLIIGAVCITSLIISGVIGNAEYFKMALTISCSLMLAGILFI